MRLPLIIGLMILSLRACARGAERDPDIAQILRDIDPARIRATIEKLASFETRHTLSDPDNPTRGIGAARNWIKQQFEQFAQDSPGRLTVEFQNVEITQTSERVPHPVTIVNVLATLPGKQL